MRGSSNPDHAGHGLKQTRNGYVSPENRFFLATNESLNWSLLSGLGCPEASNLTIPTGPIIAVVRVGAFRPGEVCEPQ